MPLGEGVDEPVDVLDDSVLGAVVESDFFASVASGDVDDDSDLPRESVR